MKKTLAIFICVCMVFAVFANEANDYKKNEIQFKLGMFPYIESVVSAFGQINNEGKPIMMPVITAEYLHYLNSRNGIGTSFTLGTPYVCFGKDNVNVSYAGLRFTYRGIYMNQPNIKLYGEVGLGAEILFTFTESMFEPFISATVSPLGLWFGSDKIFGTVEVTIGSEGTFATLGIGTRF